MLKQYLSVLFLSILVVSCTKSPDQLIKELNSDNAVTRRIAMSQLIKRHDVETVKKLIPLLNSENQRLVFIAAQLLGSMADTTAIQPLGKLIDNPNYNIRQTAVFSLGSIGNPAGLPFIVKALDDSLSGVRHDAVVSLGNIHYTPAVKYLFKMLRDNADSVRAVAIDALYQYRTSPEAGIMAADFAVPITDNSELVRFVAVQALGYAYPDSELAGDLLIDSLNDQSKFVRKEAIKSISKLNCKMAIPSLKKIYDTATVEEEYEISEAIKKITGEIYPPNSDIK
jgi:HEAT repeat protein